MELFEKILDQTEIPITVNSNGNHPIYSVFSGGIKTHIRPIGTVLDICSGDSEVSFIQMLDTVSNSCLIHDIYCDFSDDSLGRISAYMEQWDNAPSYLLVSKELFDSDRRFRKETINVEMKKPVNPKRFSNCVWNLKIFVLNCKDKKAYMLGKKVGIGGKSDKGYSMAITNVSGVIKILSGDSIS